MIRIYSSHNGVLTEEPDGLKDVWVRIAEPTDEELKTVSAKFGIDISILSAALDSDESARFESTESWTSIITDAPFIDADGNIDTEPFSIILAKNCIFTVSKIRNAVNDRFVANMKSINLSDGFAFVINMLYSVSKEYQQYLREIESGRKEIEKRIRGDVGNEDILALHSYENSLVYFITSLRGCNAVIEKIKSSDLAAGKNSKSLLKSLTIENRQNIEMAQIYREVVGSTRDMLLTMLNNKLNDNIKWIMVITFIFSIPLAIASIYGMNVDLPLQQNPAAFLLVMLVTVLSCLLIALWMKMKRFY